MLSCTTDTYHLKMGDFVKVASGVFKDYYTVVTILSYVDEIEINYLEKGIVTK